MRKPKVGDIWKWTGWTSINNNSKAQEYVLVLGITYSGDYMQLNCLNLQTGSINPWSFENSNAQNWEMIA